MADPDFISNAANMPPSPEVTDGVPDGAPTGDGSMTNDAAEPRPKSRGRQRLLRGLQRMSSSPALARVGRARSASSPYSISGTLSCVSLASTPSPFGQPSATSYFSHSSAAGSSSAQTSIPATPIAESPRCAGIEPVFGVRAVEGTAVPTSTTASLPANIRRKARTFSLWASLPHELRVYILSFLQPKELVRASRVSKEFHRMCFDGQLWTSLDASEFYREIPAESLAKIIVAAGPFVRDLNLRGCVQVEHYERAEVVVKACRNLVNATLEGCRNFKRSTLHSLLKANNKLAYLNLTGLAAVNNATCKIVANSCPQLKTLDVSWCKHMDARGIKFVVEACARLTDLRAREVKGFNNNDVAEAIFHTNKLERLVLAGCSDITDTALRIMIEGPNPEIDCLTDRPMVPPRKLRHLDLSGCSRLSNAGVKALAHQVPDLEGLQLSGVIRLTDAALEPILASTPRLTYLELEDLSHLTNALLSQHLAKSPCAPVLQHLSISSCEHLSDVGMLPVFRNCTGLRSVYMDSTRVSDLVLVEAASMVRERSSALAAAAAAPRRTSTADPSSRHRHVHLPVIGLSLVVYDCPNVTWTGVREVLNRNAELHRYPQRQTDKGKGKGKASAPDTAAAIVVEEDEHRRKEDGEVEGDQAGAQPQPAEQQAPPAALPPAEIIGLKCFYGWQMTVDEHTKRVLRGDLAAARRLERKWADYMQANEEAGVAGAGGRRRRRRAREAQQVHHQEEEAGGLGDGDGNGNGIGAGGGRRRARTIACVVM